MIPFIWQGNNSYNSGNLMSFGALPLNRFAHRCAVMVLMLALSGGVSAVGLGELRGQPVLGERMSLEIDLLGAEKQKLDASCFRLVQPSGSGDLPWLKKAVFGIRAGAQPVLELRSDVPLREPILQLAVQLACGHEVSREYIVMASPVMGNASALREPHTPVAIQLPEKAAVRRPVRLRSSVLPVDDAQPARLPIKRSERRSLATGLPDRLMLSDGGDVEPSLRLATELLGGSSAQEAQREILRLEYRMLMAMQEQAISQMATAEKLRNMEGTLGELQQRASEFARRVESTGTPSSPNASAPAVANSSQPAGGGGEVSPRKVLVAAEDSSGISDWLLWGLLLGGGVGLAAWLGWRNYQAKRSAFEETEPPLLVPELRVDPKRVDEREEPGGIDLPFEPVVMGMPMQVDVELESGGEHVSSEAEMPVKPVAHGHDSVLSIHATTLDEHFEANPVMELADIMLSFGRVKGAAQALQEYIDHNPQEALQPWIRLMDVYRMAGMRAEFETVARNLNQHFNVEVQSWDDGGLPAHADDISGDAARPVAPRPQSIEDLPRLMNTIIELWNSGDVVGYLYQLLRDNRGGQRLGFTLPVVEDVLFLIELKETANRMEKTL